MKTLKFASLLFATVLLSSSAMAQSGSGMKAGMGSQNYRLNSGNVYGWQLMSAEERSAHQQKMHSMKTYDECKAYQEQHHTEMEARAKEQGKTLPAPGHNGCNQMKARGFFK